MLAKLTYKNQITLPKEIARLFPGVEYFDVATEKGEIVLRPVSISPSGARLEKLRKKIRALGLNEQDIQSAVKWARGGR